MKNHRNLPFIGIVLGFVLLALQMSLTLPARMATGASLTASIIFYFSFFTILSNIGVAVSYLAALTHWQWLGWFRMHQTRTMFAVLILIVMLVYHFVLAGIWQPVGLFKLADIGLHYVAPLVYLIWWATLPRSETLTYKMINAMMVPALIYLIYIIARGALTGLYPYPFIDAGILGYSKTLLNALGLYAITAAMMALFIWNDRQLLKFSKK